jgi:hypothetical protein
MQETSAQTVLVAVASYQVGVRPGMTLVNLFSAPKIDKSTEAVMTGFFYVGPALAVSPNAFAVRLGDVGRPCAP